MPKKVTERLYQNIFWGFTPKKVLYNKRSKYQKISLYEHPVLGKVLLLDDVVQFCTQDEHLLHEALVYWPFMVKKQIQNVLIVGGGDLAIASRLIANKTIKKIVVVDIDQEVVSVAKRFFPEFSQAVVRDPRVEIVTEDAGAYIKTILKERFDLVIADTTDEVGVGEVLYSRSFLKDLHTVLSPDGILVKLGGSLFLQKNTLLRAEKLLKNIFGEGAVGQFGLPLNMYQGGLYIIFACFKNGKFSNKIIPGKKLPKVRWYSKNVHNAISLISENLIDKNI